MKKVLFITFLLFMIACMGTQAWAATYYVSTSLGGKLDLAILEQWLLAIEPYVESGQVQWNTLPEMYDAYAAEN